MIHFKNVHIGYDSPIFGIDNLTLEKGQIYVLIGKNGAGKSTFLRTITQQERPISGEIRLNQTLLSNIKNTDISRHIAFVGSTFPLIDYLQVNDFVALGRTPHTNALGRLRDHDKEIISNAIDSLGIEHLKHKYTQELSDGERQMAAIARAIAQETEVILLDEPTAFLDYSNRLKVLHLLKKVALEMGKCIVLSSHDIALSIEAQCPFLVLSQREKKLQLLEPPIQKEHIIDLAF